MIDLRWDDSLHCFVEESVSIFSTLIVAISSNATKVCDGGGRSEKFGAGASLVDSRISAIFPAKKSKCSADVMQEDEELFVGESRDCRFSQVTCRRNVVRRSVCRRSVVDEMSVDELSRNQFQVVLLCDDHDFDLNLYFKLL